MGIILALTPLLLLSSGCSTTPKPQTLPPGALNTFDAQSYVDLMGAQAVLNSVKADYAKGNLPAAAKPALNTAIASYNVAEAAWQAYHATGTGDTAKVTNSIQQAVADAVTLLTATTGGK